MPAKIILLRHGQSAWNEKNRFTGWVDIPLSEKGVAESREGGEEIAGIPIDVAFTSSLVRAQITLCLALLSHKSGKIPVFLHSEKDKLGRWAKIYSKAAQEETIPVHLAWQLNERMYGHLQGLNKAETAEKFGQEQVHIWRRSYDVAPPHGESLKMTAARALPYFRKRIFPRVKKGETVLVVAHGNSLRAIVMEMEGLTADEVVRLEIATGKPLVYSYTRNQWKKE